MHARLALALASIAAAAAVGGCATSHEATTPNAPYDVPKQACDDFRALFLPTDSPSGLGLGLDLRKPADFAKVAPDITNAVDEFVAGLEPIVKRSEANLPQYHELLSRLAGSLAAASDEVAATAEGKRAGSAYLKTLVQIAVDAMSAARYACRI